MNNGYSIGSAFGAFHENVGAAWGDGGLLPSFGIFWGFANSRQNDHGLHKENNVTWTFKEGYVIYNGDGGSGLDTVVPDRWTKHYNKTESKFHIGKMLPNFKADIGFGWLKFKGLHYGVPEFETSLLNDRGAVTPGFASFYPTGGSRNPSYYTHEPGHALQFLILGPFYYPLIAVPSILHSSDNDSNNHYHEKSANQLWYWFTGETDNSNPLYSK